jgi:hypothetical protein
MVVSGEAPDDNAFRWNAQERKWDVSPKRAFAWNFDPGESLPFYFVPVDFFP